MVSINTLSAVLAFRRPSPSPSPSLSPSLSPSPSPSPSSSSSSMHSSFPHTSQENRNTPIGKKRKRLLSTCTTATSILFFLAVADLVASTSVALSSSKSLLIEPTHSIHREKPNQHSSNFKIPQEPGSAIVHYPDMAPSTPNILAELGKRQVAPWPTESYPPPGGPSISVTTNLRASTMTSKSSPPSTSTTGTTVTTPSSTRPVVPTPGLDRPAVKPPLLTDFEYETMWNPNYDTLRLGVLLPFSTKATERVARTVRKSMSAIRLAVDDANRQRLVPGLNLTIVVRDSQDPSLVASSGGVAAITAAGSILSVKVSGVIGDILSEVTRYEAMMTSSVQIPQCSFASASTSLSDSNTFPYFFRTIPTTIVLLDAILEVVRSAAWNRISLIYDIETIGWSGREYFAAKANRMGIFILAYQPLTTEGVPYDPSFEFVKNRIDSSQSRIQVLIAAGTLQESVLRAMKDAGLFGPEYAWVTINDISKQLRRQDDVKAYDGLIMVDNGWELNGYKPFETFLSEWMTLNPAEYPGAGDPELNNDEGMAYSCVMMLAQAYGRLVNNTIPAGEKSERRELLLQGLKDGEHTEEIVMPRFFGNTTYPGPSGPITLDHNGDRKEGYYIALSMRDGVSIIFGVIFSGNYSSIRAPYFKDGYPTYPKDAPPWAIQNPRWSTTSGIVYSLMCFFGFFMTLASAILVLHFRNKIVIKASSPTFCLCELLGIFMALVWCILHIGIPTEAICATESFLLPLGITLLAGSLTIKNYRIYRIFNSITVENQAFKTRKLLRYLVAIVILSAVPTIVEVAVDPPKPALINIRSYQWVRCRGIHYEIWWQLAAAAIPTLLILFGVFLAFKTRNVGFLWNEAKQISLVLYNVLFFTFIIAISQAFPPEIYLATFYITIIGTWFLAVLALIVLFVPKFWHIFKSRDKWGRDQCTCETRGQITTTGGGVGGGMGTSAALARIPGELDDGAGAHGRTLDPVTAEGVLSPVIGSSSHAALQRILSVPSVESGRSRRSVRSMEANPLGAWMKTKVPQKGMVPAIGTFNGTLLEAPGDAEHVAVHHHGRSSMTSNGTGKALEKGKVDFDLEASTDSARKGGVHRTVDADPLRTHLVHDRTFDTSASGAHRVLDCYVFLLPIRVIKSRIVNILSHWAMATIILIPEAHAFMAVDSTDGRSSSYLMLTMTQLRKETKPTLRVTTCHSGALLIRFSTQERLDSWMRLFSEEDLQDLSGRPNSAYSDGSSFPVLPSFVERDYLGLNPQGLGIFGSNMNICPEMDEFQQQVRQQHEQQALGLDFQRMSVGSQDMLAIGGGAALESMMPGPNKEQHPGSSQKRQTGTAQLSSSNPMNRLWVQKDSTKSTNGDIVEELPTWNTAQSSAGSEIPSPDNSATIALPGESKKNIALKETETVFEKDKENDNLEFLAQHMKSANKSTVEGKNAARSDSSPESHNDLPVSSISSETPELSALGESDITPTHSTPSLREDVADSTSPLAPGDVSAFSTPVSKTNGTPVVSSTDSPISNTHPAGFTTPARSHSVDLPSSAHVANPYAMIVRPLPPDDEAGDAFYEDAVLSDTDKPMRPNITDMEFHPSREFFKHRKLANSMTAILSLPQVDSIPRTRNIPRVAKFPIVPQLEPRPPSPALARSLRQSSPADVLDLDDDSEDDLYDPEFGIGPGRRRRRYQSRLPGMSNKSAFTNTVIPSADVISAAAKAVSQGWSESDALQMAMRNSQHPNNNSSSTPGSGALSKAPLRTPTQHHVQQSSDPGRPSQASDDAHAISPHASVGGPQRSELPLLSPPVHGDRGNANEQTNPPTPPPILDEHDARLMASSRSTILPSALGAGVRRDSDTGLVLAPAIAAPTVSSVGSKSATEDVDDALVAPLAMYPTEDQPHV